MPSRRVRPGDCRHDPGRDLVVAAHQLPSLRGPLHVAVAEGPERGERRTVVGLHAPMAHHRLGEEAAAATTAAASFPARRLVPEQVPSPGPSPPPSDGPVVPHCPPPGPVPVPGGPPGMNGSSWMGGTHRLAAARVVGDPVARDVLHDRLPRPRATASTVRSPSSSAPRVPVYPAGQAPLVLSVRTVSDISACGSARRPSLPAARRDELGRPPFDAVCRHRLLAPPDLPPGHLPVVRRAREPAAVQRVVLPLCVVGPAVIDQHLPGTRTTRSPTASPRPSWAWRTSRVMVRPSP